MGRMSGVRASILALVIALVMTLSLSSPADAAPKWCEDDPIVVIGGSWAQVLTKFESRYISTITGPLAYDIYVPDSVYSYTRVYLPPSPVAKTVNVHALPTGYWPDWSSPGKIKLEIRMLVPATSEFTTLSDVTGSMKKAFRVRSASNLLTVFHISLH